MMCLPTRRVFTSVILITLAAFTLRTSAAQTQRQKDKTSEAYGAISGKVTNDGQPARGVIVLLQSSDVPMMDASKFRSRTDQNGHFEIKGVPAGTYQVQAFAPALTNAVENTMFARQGTVINLSDNEVVDGVELALRPGGVITGRVSDADGKPLVQENVRIFSIDESNRKQPTYLPFNYMFSTDDRGEYRIFGLPPGKYLAGVGIETTAPGARINMGSTYHPLTYHPDVTDQAKATVIEVAGGSEASGIDIIVGKPTKGYSVSGQIVDDTTGKPVAGLTYGYGAYDPQRNMLNSTASSGGTTSNARGEFRIEGITPGRYAAFAISLQDSGLYSGLGDFTVTDSDVSGVVVKVHQGTTISGRVTLEGAEGLANAPRLSDVRLSAYVPSRGAAPRGSQVQVAPDGSFRATGLPAGLVNFSIASPLKGLAISRIERDGVNQTISGEREGNVFQVPALQIGAGEEVSGINIVLSYGTGSIRGQVEVEGGEITPNTALYLTIRRADTKQQVGMRSPIPDVRGRFIIEGLGSGEYELSLFIGWRPEPGKRPISKTVIQKVSVTNGVETQATVRVNLTAEDRPK